MHNFFSILNIVRLVICKKWLVFVTDKPKLFIFLSSTDTVPCPHSNDRQNDSDLLVVNATAHGLYLNKYFLNFRYCIAHIFVHDTYSCYTNDSSVPVCSVKNHQEDLGTQFCSLFFTSLFRLAVKPLTVFCLPFFSFLISGLKTIIVSIKTACFYFSFIKRSVLSSLLLLLFLK